MESKFSARLATLYLIICIWKCNLSVAVKAQEESSQEMLMNGNPSALIQAKNLTNQAQSSQVLILIPASTNLSESRDQHYNLFKVNSELLFKRDFVNMAETTIAGLNENNQHEGDLEIRRRVKRDLDGVNRKSRFLKGIWKKPKLSPLFLVNGTVCRNIDGAPVCTSLTTTGFPTGPATVQPLASGNLPGGGGGNLPGASSTTTTQQPRPAG